MKSEVYFADEKIREAYKKLSKGKSEDRMIYEWISNALSKIEENAFSGIQIKKSLIPKIYIKKYGIKNLWKYNLPQGWRLLYSLTDEGIVLISIILEWLPHKEYEKRFSY
ncbi:MAG: hypothetical protein ABIB71_05265 [Candidatus Woesearchaeota archaeon]